MSDNKNKKNIVESDMKFGCPNNLCYLFDCLILTPCFPFGLASYLVT